MHNLSQLNIWKKAVDFCTKIYTLTSVMPADERFGLTNQIRRAAVSIASNIAEGAGHNSNPDFVRCLALANGSCYELETQLIIARNLSFLDNIDAILVELDELQKMNYKLQEYLKNNQLKEPNVVYGISEINDLNTQY